MRCSFALVVFLLAACTDAESDPPRSPLVGDACSGLTTTCDGIAENILYCDGETLKSGLDCPNGVEGEGRHCHDRHLGDGVDPGLPACSYEYGRLVYFGLPGGTCTADETFRACTTDARRFLTCHDGVLVDPCPADFALDVDCPDVEQSEPPSARALECVGAGQQCFEEGRYDCVAGTFRCEDGLLVASDVCDASGGRCEVQKLTTHVVCGNKRRAEAGKPCDRAEEPTCSGDDADLLECVEGTWAATRCPRRCSWPVEYDPPFCE